MICINPHQIIHHPMLVPMRKGSNESAVERLLFYRQPTSNYHMPYAMYALCPDTREKQETSQKDDASQILENILALKTRKFTTKEAVETQKTDSTLASQKTVQAPQSNHKITYQIPIPEPITRDELELDLDASRRMLILEGNHNSENFSTSFTRQFHISDSADISKLSASFADHLLHVEFERLEEVTSDPNVQRISIE
ncbi:hypothetical protein MT418_005769 [Batrachochytrium dendrobatidis]